VTHTPLAIDLAIAPTVCRKSYVHPGLISAYEVGRFALEAEAEGETTGLRPEERAVLALLQALQSGAAADIANASEAIRWTTDGRGRLHQDLVAREPPPRPSRPRGRRSAANSLVSRGRVDLSDVAAGKLHHCGIASVRLVRLDQHRHAGSPGLVQRCGQVGNFVAGQFPAIGKRQMAIGHQ